MSRAIIVAPREPVVRETRRSCWLRYWQTPPGLIMATVAGLVLGRRLYLLSRPGYLDGITEDDNGVYLGGAI